MNPQDDSDELRPEYSEELIRSGVRGKYAEKYRSQSNVIVIDDDLTEAFPNTKAVNDALRDYLKIRNKTAT